MIQMNTTKHEQQYTLINAKKIIMKLKKLMQLHCICSWKKKLELKKLQACQDSNPDMCDTHAPGGIIQILRDRYDQMGAKIKTPKSPWP